MIPLVREDPLMQIAFAAAMCDPGAWIDMDTDDESLRALRTMRDYMPDIYAGAILELQEGAANTDDYILSELKKMGLYMEDISWVGYDLYIPGHGFDLEYPNTYEEHPEIIPLVSLFDAGILEGEEVSQVQINVASRLMGSLKPPHPLWCAIGWVFGLTNNTWVDWTYDAVADLEPLSWDEVDFARGAMKEVEVFTNNGKIGLKMIAEDAAVRDELAANIQLARKGSKDEFAAGVVWREAERAASAYTELLLVWDFDAEA